MNWNDNDRFPDSIQSLNQAKLEPNMSPAEFWWIHLTFAQRSFITKQYADKPIVHGDKGFSVEDAFKKSGEWRNMQGWPEWVPGKV